MGFTEPMKAMQAGELLPNLIDSDTHGAERKYDGTRLEAEKIGDKVTLWGRSGIEYTKNFPDLVADLKKIRVNFKIDGEIVYLNAKGDDKFDEVSRRVRIEDPVKRMEYIKKYPTIYFVFDILSLGGLETTDLPLKRRKQILTDVIHPTKNIQLTAIYLSPSSKKGLIRDQERLKREGVMFKNLNSPYNPGRRSPNWRKLKFFKEDSAIVIGYERGKGKREGVIGALYTAQVLPNGQLWYTGKIGTGFKEKKLGRAVMTNKEFKNIIDPFILSVRNPRHINKRLNIRNLVEKVSGPELVAAVWVMPRVIIDVKYREMSSGGRFREGVFLKYRYDLKITDARYKGK